MNTAIICGKAMSEPVFSHRVRERKFYLLMLEAERLSDTVDSVPILIDEKAVKKVKVGGFYQVKGQVRTFNKRTRNSRTKLLLFIFALDLKAINENECSSLCGTNNEVIIEGFLCKTPVFRKTPLKRDITELIVAINRKTGQSDYVHCIAWGKDAVLCKDFKTGDKVKVYARFQSRPYNKIDESGKISELTAYELSVSNIVKLEEVKTKE